jgi:chromate reductase
VHVVGFAGSLRRGSYNKAVLRAAGGLLPAGMTLETVDLAPIPLYNADLEAAGRPQPVTDFKVRLLAVDALPIVTPEYNYSVPGVLKNAIDCASRTLEDSPLNRKPAAIMGAGAPFGTLRAQQHLRQLLLHNNVLVLGKPEVSITDAWEKFDAAGRLIDEQSRERIQVLVARGPGLSAAPRRASSAGPGRGVLTESHPKWRSVRVQSRIF